MVAKIRTSIIRDMADFISYDASINDINNAFDKISLIVDKIKQKIEKRGFKMSSVQMEHATSITNLVEVFNRNMDKINTFLFELEKNLDSDYLLKKELLEVMGIDYVNNDGASSMVIYNNRVEISKSDGQLINIHGDTIESTKDGETKVITHA